MGMVEARIVAVFGTRPEAIKMAPVIIELNKAREQGQAVETIVCVTGQHKSMLRQALDVFGIRPDYDLDVMEYDQNLFTVTSRVIEKVGKALESISPELVLVHGDTTTTFATSLAAYYHRIKIGHVEAGLRSGNKYSPFPEEINRRLTDVLADYHFCPTESAKLSLINEGVKEDGIVVTGNTVIDALKHTLRRLKSDKVRRAELEKKFAHLGSIRWDRKLILVTGHRRESFGEGLASICAALKEVVAAHEEIEVVYPVHLNPNVKKLVHSSLESVQRIHLLAPLDYEEFVFLMDKAYIVLTDSGGIQEEAPSLGIPVLVTRDVTERPEGVEAGNAKVVGTERRVIVREVSRLLLDPEEYERMSKAHNPYGDGEAAGRIVKFLFRSRNLGVGVDDG